MTEREYVSKVIHDLDHQKYEVIGVENLANECHKLISVLLINLKCAPLTGPQLAASVRALPMMLGCLDCERCDELAERIKNHLVLEFTETQK